MNHVKFVLGIVALIFVSTTLGACTSHLYTCLDGDFRRPREDCSQPRQQNWGNGWDDSRQRRQFTQGGFIPAPYVQVQPAPQAQAFRTDIWILNSSACGSIRKIEVLGSSVTNVGLIRELGPGESDTISFSPFGSGDVELVATMYDGDRLVGFDYQKFRIEANSSLPQKWVITSCEYPPGTSLYAPVPGTVPDPAMHKPDCKDCPPRSKR